MVMGMVMGMDTVMDMGIKNKAMILFYCSAKRIQV